MVEEKSSFEKFKEWEKNIAPNFKDNYMNSLKNTKTVLGDIDLEKYAEGMSLLKEETLKSLTN